MFFFNQSIFAMGFVFIGERNYTRKRQIVEVISGGKVFDAPSVGEQKSCDNLDPTDCRAERVQLFIQHCRAAEEQPGSKWALMKPWTASGLRPGSRTDQEEVLKPSEGREDVWKPLAGEGRLASTPLFVLLNQEWGEVWEVAMATSSV